MSEPAAPPPAPVDLSDRNVMLVLSYIGLLALIPLLTKREDREIQWHAKHGLVLTAFFFVIWVVISIITSVGIGCFFVFLYPIVGITWLVVVILSITKALKGERFLIPGVSDLVDRF